MVVKIEDDGCGFDLNSIKSNNGIGIDNMKQRIKIIEGSFDLTSKINVGTKLVIQIPLN